MLDYIQVRDRIILAHNNKMGCCCIKLSKNRNSDQAFPTSQNILHDSFSDEKYVSNLAFVRIQGEETKELLHRSIVALRFKNPMTKNSFIHGSGVLLSNDLVLTAAHNLYEKNYNMQFVKKGYQVFEGVDGVAEIVHEIEDWRYLPEFRTCQISNKLQFDYVLIKLKPSQLRPIAHDQFLELRPPCKRIHNKDPQLKIEIYGYPQYKQNYEPMNKQLTRLKLFQYGLSLPDSIIEFNPAEFKITYVVSTLGGQSGCPIVVDNQIIAIHTGANKKEENSNIGRVVTSDLVKNVEQWKNQLGGSSISLSEKAVCPHNYSKIRQEGQPRQQMEETNQIVMEYRPYFAQRLSSSLINNSAIAQAHHFEENANKLKEEYKYDMALDQYMKSMVIYEELKGKDSTQVAAILIYGIGHIYGKQGKYLASLEAYERGKAIFEKKEGRSNYNNYNIAVSFHRIGWIYYLMSEYNLALQKYEKALSITQKIKGKDSVEAGGMIGIIGLVYWRKQDYELALQYLKRSLYIKEKAGKGISIGAAKTYNNIGAVYDDQKEYLLALENYQKALTIKRISKGKDSVEVALTTMNIGLVYYNKGDSHRAVDTYKQVIAIYQKHQLKHREYARAHFNLGNTYYKMKDYTSAAVAYRISLPIFVQIGLTADVKESSFYLAQCLYLLGESGELQKIVKEYRVVLL